MADREFSSLTSFITHFSAIALALHEEEHHMLKKAAVLVENTAKEKLGHYQPAVGGFPAWAELADSTKKERLEQGYTENDPLLRSGALRDSISHEIEGNVAAIGSTSDYAIDQEAGTNRIPPRPFLAPALIENINEVKAIIGEGTISVLLGNRAMTTSFKR